MSRCTRFSLLAALFVVSMTSASNAQPVDTDYNVERFQLSTDRGGILGVELAEVIPHFDFDLSTWFGYANDPLNIYQEVGGERERVGSIVADRLGGNLLFAIGLFDRVEVALDVPLIFSQSDDLDGVMQVPELGTSFGLGDIRVLPKVALLRGKTSLSVALGLTLPTSSDSEYLGDGQVTFVPELLASHRFGARLRAGLGIGYRFREQRRAINLEVDDEVFAHAGVGYMVTEMVELDGTFSYATGSNDLFSSFNRNFSELRGGVALHINNLVPFVGAGIGTSEGFGTPDWRVLLGVRYTFMGEGPKENFDRLVKDTDGDGLSDDVDKCIDEPETFNAIEDDDGCPEAQADVDSDGDGLFDRNDECPSQPEDLDSHEDDNGCPDPDNDADGVLDSADNCMNVFGPVENRGCPDTDIDGDTVVDRVDNCPDEPGTVENQGCKKKQLVVIRGGRLEILDRVFFRTNKDVIVRRSYKLLNNVASVLNNHPEIKQILVEGHTDDRGNDAYNKDLSQRRAEAVRKYLIRKGVGPERLEAVGYGEEKPIETNGTKDGRGANRRVEFNLLGEGQGIDSQDSGPGGDTIDD